MIRKQGAAHKEAAPLLLQCFSPFPLSESTANQYKTKDYAEKQCGDPEGGKHPAPRPFDVICQLEHDKDQRKESDNIQVMLMAFLFFQRNPLRCCSTYKFIITKNESVVQLYLHPSIEE